MRVSPKLRRALLLAGLAATLVAVYWASRLPGDEAAVAPGAQAERPRPQNPARPRAETSGGGNASEAGITGGADAGMARRIGAPRRADTVAEAGANRALDLSRLKRPRNAEPSDNLFGSHNFAPAPPPLPKRPIARPADQIAAAPPPPPPPPAPPPMPFTYLGRLAEGPQTTVFLAAGDRNLVVKAGDVIDNTYRVDEVGERMLMLTYLPQNVKQLIPIGAP
jgi:hypothetical protein